MYSIPGLLDCWAVRDYTRFARVLSGSEHARTDARRGASAAEANRRDAFGRTVLHLVAASAERGADAYLAALLAHAAVNVNAQDAESGWTALHRALYAGNLRTAAALIAHPDIDLEVRDYDGLTPLALYATSVRGTAPDDAPPRDMYVWGANRNYSFGLGHCDDCALPERVRVGRAEARAPGTRFDRVAVRGVAMSRWHTLVLTDEPGANAYICGVGGVGRLGRLHHTQPRLERVRDVDEHVTAAAAAPDYTLLVTASGALVSFGSNRMATLGYTIEDAQGTTASTGGTLRAGARPDPGCGMGAHGTELDVQVTPRRVLGALKKQHVLGAAAGRLHAAAFTADGLYTWGTNTGQLGYDKSTARVQLVPRRVAAITDRVVHVAAAEHATACLLATGDAVALYAEACHRIAPHVPGAFAAPRAPAITQLAAGGHTVAVLTSIGDVYTYTLPPPAEKARIPRAQLVWSARSEFVARGVAVGADGSLAVCLASGHVYVRVSRAGARARFTKVPFLNRAVAVHTNGYGGFAALQAPAHVPLHIAPRAPLAREVGGAADAPPDDFAAHARWLVEQVHAVRAGGRASFSRWPGADATVVADGCAVPVHTALIAARAPPLAAALRSAGGGPDLHLDTSLPAALLVLAYLYTDIAPAVWSAAAMHEAMSLVRAEHIDMPRLRAEAQTLADKLGLAELSTVLASSIPRVPVPTLRRDMRALFDATVRVHPTAPPHTDTVLHLADGFVPCHAFALCRAGAFPPLFAWRRDAQAPPPWVVDMQHVPWRTMRTALLYLYTDADIDAVFAGTDAACDTADAYIDYVLDVLVLADELLIDKLRDMCMVLLARRVKPSNVAAMITDADSYNATALRDACIAYAARDLASLLESRLLDGLSAAHMRRLEDEVRGAQAAHMGHTHRLDHLTELMVRHHDYLESLDIPRPSLGLACLKVRGKPQTPRPRERCTSSEPPSADSSMIFVMDDEWHPVGKRPERGAHRVPQAPPPPPAPAPAPQPAPAAPPPAPPPTSPPLRATPRPMPRRASDMASSPTNAPPITPEAQAALKSMPVLTRVSQKERKKQQRSEESTRARAIPSAAQPSSWRPSSQETVWRGSPSLREASSSPLESSSPGPLSFAQIQQQQAAALSAAQERRAQPAKSFARILEEERAEQERVREEQRAAEEFERWFEEESRRVQQQQRATRENRAREQRGRNRRQPRRKAPARIDD